MKKARDLCKTVVEVSSEEENEEEGDGGNEKEEKEEKEDTEATPTAEGTPAGEEERN